MVDAEHLGLFEDPEHAAVQLARLLQRRAEGLLDDHAHLGALVVGEAGLTEHLQDLREEARSGGQVEGAVEHFAGALLEAVEGL